MLNGDKDSESNQNAQSVMWQKSELMLTVTLRQIKMESKSVVASCVRGLSSI